jgi:hypothetical protein
MSRFIVFFSSSRCARVWGEPRPAPPYRPAVPRASWFYLPDRLNRFPEIQHSVTAATM